MKPSPSYTVVLKSTRGKTKIFEFLRISSNFFEFRSRWNNELEFQNGNVSARFKNIQFKNIQIYKNIQIMRVENSERR